MLKLIVFDLDGTLVDTRKDICNSVNFSLNAFGLPPKSLDEVVAAVGHGIENLILKCVPEKARTDSQIREILKCYRGHYRENCTVYSAPYSGVESFLSTYKSIPFAVLSNKPEEYCKILLKNLNLDSFFHPIFGGDSTKHKKPHPMGLLKILDILGVAPEESLMVGDSAPDVEAGQKAGVPTVGILGGMGNPQEVIKSGPTHCIHHFNELENLVKKDYILD